MNANKYIEERDKMLLKGDINELRKFVKENEKLYTPMFVDSIARANDDLLEMVLHKMIVNCINLPSETRKKSAEWLKAYGT